MNKKKLLLLVVTSVAATGTVMLFRTFAAGPLASFEAETITNPVGSISTPTSTDPAVSGGKFLQFGQGVAAPGNLNTQNPLRAAFYYPWFPETWTVNGAHVAYNPILGYYDSSTQSVVDNHIQALDYGKIQVGIASWWGINTHNESTRVPLLLSRTQALNASVKWALYYESEGFGDPTVAQLQTELSYIKSKYAVSPSYAYVNGKPVLFVYNASANDNTCALADKWAQANASIGFYLSLKVFSGYKACTSQPDTWHQYGPATATDSQVGYSYTISPGFWRADETTARLARDPAQWTTNVKSMVASGAPWQIVTTFNEWGEGTAVESANDWSSASGYGVYLDTLHNN